MSYSLDKLVSILPNDAFKHTAKEFKGKKLMKQKDVYPYDYMDSFENFDQTQLPTKEQFFSSILNDCYKGLNMTIQEKFGKDSTLRQWLNTKTLTLKVTFFCYVMYSKILEIPVYNITNWIHTTISQALVLVGMLC